MDKFRVHLDDKFINSPSYTEDQQELLLAGALSGTGQLKLKSLKGTNVIINFAQVGFIMIDYEPDATDKRHGIRLTPEQKKAEKAAAKAKLNK